MAEAPSATSEGRTGSLYSIEYPGIVRNVGAAVASLGGQQRISKAVSAGSSILSLHFRPDDPLSHPVFGERHACRGLLLRVARGEDAAAPQDVRLVGPVGEVFRFPGMADFQFVADATLSPQPAGEPNPHLDQLYGEGAGEQPLLTVPPLFTRLDMPVAYNFRSFYGEDPSHLRMPSGPKGRGHLPWHVVKFVALRVPPAVTLAQVVEGGFKPERREQLRQLHELFAERSIWSPDALAEKLGGRPLVADVEALLPRVAYTFRSGPFRALWIRRGVDPRADPTSRKFQPVTYSPPEAWSERLANAAGTTGREADAPAAPAGPRTAASYSDLVRFRGMPPGRSAVLQLCDIEDASIRKVLARQGSGQASCDHISGWLTPDELETVRRRVAARFQALLDDAARASSAEPSEAAAQPEDLQGAAPMDTESAERVRESPVAQEAQEPQSIVPTAIIDSLVQSWPQRQAGAGASASPEKQPDALERPQTAQETSEAEEDESDEAEAGEDDEGEDEDEDDEEAEDEDEDEDEEEEEGSSEADDSGEEAAESEEE